MRRLLEVGGDLSGIADLAGFRAMCRAESVVGCGHQACARRSPVGSCRSPWMVVRAGGGVYADADRARMRTAFVYSQGHEGGSEYRGPLPHGLDFSMGQAEVQASFPRPPDFTSDEHDAWDFDDYRLVAQYRRAGT